MEKIFLFPIYKRTGTSFLSTVAWDYLVIIHGEERKNDFFLNTLFSFTFFFGYIWILTCCLNETPINPMRPYTDSNIKINQKLNINRIACKINKNQFDINPLKKKVQNSLCATFDTGEAQPMRKSFFCFSFRANFSLHTALCEEFFYNETRPGTQKTHNRPLFYRDQTTPLCPIGAPTNIYPDILCMRCPFSWKFTLVFNVGSEIT